MGIVNHPIIIIIVVDHSNVASMTCLTCQSRA